MPSPLQAINGSSRPVGMASASSLGGASPQRSEELSPMPLPMDGYADLPAAAVLQQQAGLAGLPANGAASLYIKGMPEDADKLWLYEKFARWGAFVALSVPPSCRIPGLSGRV